MTIAKISSIEAFCGAHIQNSGTRRPKNIEFRDCTFRKTANLLEGRYTPCPETLGVTGADNVTFRHCRIINAAPGAFRSDDAPGLKTEDCNF